MREIRTLGPVLVAAIAGTVLAQSDSVGVDLAGLVVDFPDPGDITRDTLNNPAPGSDNFINEAGGYAFSINGLLQLRDPIFGLPLGDPVLLTTCSTSSSPAIPDCSAAGSATSKGGSRPRASRSGRSSSWAGRSAPSSTSASRSPSTRRAWSPSPCATSTARSGSSPRPSISRAAPRRSRPGPPASRQLTEWHFDGGFDPADGLGQQRDPVPRRPRVRHDPGRHRQRGHAQPGHPDRRHRSAVVVHRHRRPPGLPALGGIDTGVYLTSPARQPLRSERRRAAARHRAGGLPGREARLPGRVHRAVDDGLGHAYPRVVVVCRLPRQHNAQPGPCRPLQDQHNNDSGADLWIRTLNGSPAIVYSTDGDDFAGEMPLPLAIQPDQWFRLAVVCDEFQAGPAGSSWTGSSLARS
jgi:hypothetical protein